MDFIAAQRILAVRCPVGAIERTEVPRLAVVVENDRLIKLLKIRHDTQ
jgi:hypothetical protein